MVHRGVEALDQGSGPALVTRPRRRSGSWLRGLVSRRILLLMQAGSMEFQRVRYATLLPYGIWPRVVEDPVSFKLSIAHRAGIDQSGGEFRLVAAEIETSEAIGLLDQLGPWPHALLERPYRRRSRPSWRIQRVSPRQRCYSAQGMVIPPNFEFTAHGEIIPRRRDRS